MGKPELLVSAGSLDEVNRYICAGADAVVVGEHRFGLRLPGEIELEELAAILQIAHENGVKVYVAVNNVFANEDLPPLRAYLQELARLKPDALVFGDPAVLMLMRELDIVLPLHWNTEMTSTNFSTADYWASKGAVRMIAARELNLEELHDFKQHSKLELQVQVHGMTNIYHSKRKLLQSYTGHVHKNLESTGAKAGLYLIEHERPDLKLPIYEDRNGTHIMSADDICMIDALDELLQEPIDSLKIETLLKPTTYNETVIRCYRKAIDAWASDPQNYVFQEEWVEEIRRLQDDDRELSYGFFFKEQVY